MLNVLILIVLSGLLAPAVARNSYTEQIVAYGDDEFFPYTRGRIIKNIEGESAIVTEQIYQAIISWDSLNPPRGFEIRFDAGDRYAELSFAAYVRDGELRTTRSGAILSFYINDPVRVLGSPVAEDIFLQPEIVDDFYGFPVYQNTDSEVTVISKSKAPLFIPVTREEYLRQLINTESARNDKKEGSAQKSDSEIILAEMEKSYIELLKVDPGAAAEFKTEIQRFRTDIANDQDDGAPVSLLASLQAELSGLSAAERLQPAYYAAGAFEKYGNFSGLVPESGKNAGTALVRPAPSYIGMSGNNSELKVLILAWNIGSDNSISDKPRLYDGDAKGFRLADYFMARLYHQQSIWNIIFRL
jgi:hypothetical protein